MKQWSEWEEEREKGEKEREERGRKGREKARAERLDKLSNFSSSKVQALYNSKDPNMWSYLAGANFAYPHHTQPPAEPQTYLAHRTPSQGQT